LVLVKIKQTMGSESQRNCPKGFIKILRMVGEKRSSSETGKRSRAMEIVSPTWRIEKIIVCQNDPTASFESDLPAPDWPTTRNVRRKRIKKVKSAPNGLSWKNVVLNVRTNDDTSKIANEKYKESKMIMTLFLPSAIPYKKTPMRKKRSINTSHEGVVKSIWRIAWVSDDIKVPMIIIIP